jgi:hypothetical protein
VLREAQLRKVVSRPAALLFARFEPEGLAADIARRIAEESAKDAGALPLLSDLLEDMWTGMVKRWRRQAAPADGSGRDRCRASRPRRAATEKPPAAGASVVVAESCFSRQPDLDQWVAG